MVADIFNKLTKNDFEILIRFGKRSNVLFSVELPMLIYFSYKFVKMDLPDLLQSGDIEEIIKLVCEEMKIKQNNINEKELISFVLWLKDEIEIVQKLEEAHLRTEPDPDMIGAGVKELDEFGELNVIDSLADGDILKWSKVEKLPYHKVFDKLKKNIVERKVNANYQKILAQKSKSKRK